MIHTPASAEPQPPTMDTAIATALLAAYALCYVLPFYISSATRPSAHSSRDAPSVIRARIRSVTVSCLICCAVTLVLLASIEEGTLATAIHQMGYVPLGIEETIKGLLLTGILFLGPLFETAVVDGAWRDWIRLRGVDGILNDWIGWRNIVAGPVTEEILFRSASVPILLLSQTSNTTIIFLTPVIFGLAHIHHFYEYRVTHPHTPMVAAILRSLLQFSYTTLFGGYATFLYLRSASLLNVILVHAFCNWMGFPRFWGRLTCDDESLIGPDLGEAKSKDGSEIRTSGELSNLWTVMYYILLVVGAVSWYKLLWSLTESGSALSDFSKPKSASLTLEDRFGTEQTFYHSPIYQYS